MIASFSCQEDKLQVKSVPFSVLSRNWLDFTASFEVFPGEVHLWKLHGCFQDIVSKTSKIFLTDEQCHLANDMASDKRRYEYIVSRVVVKYLAAGYLHVDPHVLLIDDSTRSKPQVKKQNGTLTKYFFSWSHCQDMFVCAISLQEVGVDVELINTVNRYPRIKKLLEEKSKSLQVDSITLARYWTAIEALYKLYGKGTLRNMLHNDFQPFAKQNATCGYHIQYEDYMIAVASEEHVGIQCYSLEANNLQSV